MDILICNFNKITTDYRLSVHWFLKANYVCKFEMALYSNNYLIQTRPMKMRIKHKDLNLGLLHFILLFSGFVFQQKLTAQSTSGKETSIILPGNLKLELVKIQSGTFLMGMRPCEQDTL
jgi:hypothetical protein